MFYPDLNLVKPRRGRRLNFNSCLAEVQISRKKIRLNVRQNKGEGGTGSLKEGSGDVTFHFDCDKTRARVG